MTNLRSIVEILYGAMVKNRGQVTLPPVHKVIPDDSGQWQLIVTKQQAEVLLEWTEIVATLPLPIYFVKTQA